jgi:branched-chain amino acid aminotransferase
LGTTKDANNKGHQQVLWLYGDKKIIEVGASNIFFVFKSKNGNGKKAEIVTPDLEDLILPGVTRDSIIVIVN